MLAHHLSVIIFSACNCRKMTCIQASVFLFRSTHVSQMYFLLAIKWNFRSPPGDLIELIMKSAGTCICMQIECIGENVQSGYAHSSFGWSCKGKARSWGTESLEDNLPEDVEHILEYWRGIYIHTSLISVCLFLPHAGFLLSEQNAFTAQTLLQC